MTTCKPRLNTVLIYLLFHVWLQGRQTPPRPKLHRVSCIFYTGLNSKSYSLLTNLRDILLGLQIAVKLAKSFLLPSSFLLFGEGGGGEGGGGGSSPGVTVFTCLFHEPTLCALRRRGAVIDARA